MKRRIAILMITVLVLSGCGGGASTEGSSQAAGEPQAQAQGEPQESASPEQAVGQVAEQAAAQGKDADQTVAQAQQSSGLEEIAEQAQQTGGDPFGYEEGDAVADQREEEELPVRFDLREVEVNGSGIVPPVRFQNPFGSCWGFAAIGAAEISILGAGLAQQDGYTAETFNLSEKHLAYFAATEIEEPDDPQNGEGKQYSSAQTGAQKINSGGDILYATWLFASGMGPNLEDRDGLDPGDEEVLVYKGRKGETESRKVYWYDENGNLQKGIRRFCYSNDDDWDIPYKYRYYQSYRLRESCVLPSPANIAVDMENYTFSYTYNPQGTEAIKKQLLARRGVSIGVYTEVARPDQIDRSWKYMSDQWAQYVDKFVSPNHAVCIVGWDDEYPKENFMEGNQPPEDGAWLCRNSWGSDLNEFPDLGYRHWGIEEEEHKNNGYFWLSYYDVTIEKAESFVFDKSNVGESYLVDQYDYYPAENIAEFTTGTENKTANVFVAGESCVLTEVSVMTSTPGSEVSYEIYLLPKGYEDPADGVLAAAGSGGAFEFGGYHRIALEEPVPLFRGQYYSVVISQNTPSGKSVFCIVCDEGKTGVEAASEASVASEDGAVAAEDAAESEGAAIEAEAVSEVASEAASEVSAESGEPGEGATSEYAEEQFFGDEAWEPEEWNNLVVNERESYLFVDGEWRDLAAPEVRGAILGMVTEPEHNAYDNFPIKAYLEEAVNPVYPDFGGDLTLMMIEPENTKTLLLKLKGAVEEWDSDHEVTWRSSDEAVFTVERNANDEGVAAVTATGSGTAYLIVSIEGLGDRVVGVCVE